MQSPVVVHSPAARLRVIIDSRPLSVDDRPVLLLGRRRAPSGTPALLGCKALPPAKAGEGVARRGGSLLAPLRLCHSLQAPQPSKSVSRQPTPFKKGRKAAQPPASAGTRLYTAKASYGRCAAIPACRRCRPA